MSFISPVFVKTATGLAVAFGLGTAIGLERQYRQRTAGLRTNVLVAVGAAAFADLGGRLAGPDGAVRVVSYVVSGIGFLGAGVIMKEGTQVRGLNTAATLWASAAVGAFAGSGQTGEAVLVAAFVLAGNTLLRPLVEFVNRRPITPGETEALYRLHVLARPENLAVVRDLIAEELERHHYPVRDIETEAETDEQIELEATLLASSAEPDDLDVVVSHLEHHPEILAATWSVSAAS
jgi:putative Mg2+ transporter-C (MgtC) family protein